MDVQLLNELLLQLFREAILSEDSPPKPLTQQFQLRDGSLEAMSEDLFTRQPSALLELFVLLQQHPTIRGVRAGTMRAVVRNLWLIDEEFRQNPRNHRLFLEILRAPRAGTLHPIVRAGSRAHAVRLVPRLHSRCAHAVRGQQRPEARDP
jgi:[protein-PII] uridylyltransferase